MEPFRFDFFLCTSVEKYSIEGCAPTLLESPLEVKAAIWTRYIQESLYLKVFGVSSWRRGSNLLSLYHLDIVKSFATKPGLSSCRPLAGVFPTYRSVTHKSTTCALIERCHTCLKMDWLNFSRLARLTLLTVGTSDMFCVWNLRSRNWQWTPLRIFECAVMGSQSIIAVLFWLRNCSCSKYYTRGRSRPTGGAFLFVAINGTRKGQFVSRCLTRSSASWQTCHLCPSTESISSFKGCAVFQLKVKASDDQRNLEMLHLLTRQVAFVNLSDSFHQCDKGARVTCGSE